MNQAGTLAQTSVSRGAGPPAVPAESICLYFATIGTTANTIIATTNVAPTVAQLLATSISAHAPAVIPGFTWAANKSVGDQLVAIGNEFTLLAQNIQANSASITTLQGELWTSPNEVVTTDVKVTGLTGAQHTVRYAGGTLGGPPSSGTWAVGDVLPDLANGVLYLCTGAGTPGTWKAFDARNAYTALPTVTRGDSFWTYNSGGSTIRPLSGIITMAAASGSLAAAGASTVCTVNLTPLGLAAPPVVQVTFADSALTPVTAAVSTPLASSFSIYLINPTASAVSLNTTYYFYYQIIP
jgi:hypothetical protein